MSSSALSRMEAERAFAHATRARRRASMLRRLRRECEGCARLSVYEPCPLCRSGVGHAREIRLEEIVGTLEPGRAMEFDHEFRPAPTARARWERVWLAEHDGAVLPPIAVVPVGDGFAIRDGHHRVSVAKSRGAVAIDAIVHAA